MCTAQLGFNIDVYEPIGFPHNVYKLVIFNSDVYKSDYFWQ